MAQYAGDYMKYMSNGCWEATNALGMFHVWPIGHVVEPNDKKRGKHYIWSWVKPIINSCYCVYPKDDQDYCPTLNI